MPGGLGSCRCRAAFPGARSTVSNGTWRIPPSRGGRKRCLLRSFRHMRAGRVPQRASGRHTEGTSALGVARVGLIDRSIERPIEPGRVLTGRSHAGDWVYHGATGTGSITASLRVPAAAANKQTTSRRVRRDADDVQDGLYGMAGLGFEDQGQHQLCKHSQERLKRTTEPTSARSVKYPTRMLNVILVNTSSRSKPRLQTRLLR